MIVAGPAGIGGLGNSLVGVDQRLLDHLSITDVGSGLPHDVPHLRLSVIELIKAGLALEGQVSGLSVDVLNSVWADGGRFSSRRLRGAGSNRSGRVLLVTRSRKGTVSLRGQCR